MRLCTIHFDFCTSFAACLEYKGVAQNFRSNSSTGATRHVYDIFGEIAIDYYDSVQVSSTFARVLRHPYEIPSTLFVITTCACLYGFIRVLHDQPRVCTI